MRIDNVNLYKATLDGVIIKLINISDYKDIIINDKLLPTNIEIRFGEVIHMGPETLLPEHCPSVKVGDIVVFTQFAGYFISTNDDYLYKLIRGYDIIATISDMMNISDETILPSADRYLIAVQPKKSIEKDGLILDVDEADPMMRDLEFGKILKIGPAVLNTDLEIGSIIGYDPYAGEIVKKSTVTNEPDLKVIREPDILIFK